MGPTLVFVMAACAAPPPAFEVRTHAGATSGAPARVAAGAITMADGTVLPAGDWYSLRRAPGVLPPWPGRAYLEFGNGDRLAGTVVEGDGTALTLQLSDGAQTLRFPLSALRAVWVRPPADDGPDWLAGPRRRDVVQSKTGDRVLGAIETIDAAKNVLRYQADGKAQQMEWARVAAIGFNTDLARVRKPKGPYYRLTLADGSRVSVAALEFDGAAWTADTLFKGTFRLPADRVLSVDVEQGKALSLADLKPAKYQYASFDGEEFIWTADRNVLGRPLRLKTSDGDSTFDRGLGLHAECTVTYSLSGKYHRFEATAGIDARDGRLGDAELSIQVDGQARDLARGGQLSSDVGPIPIRVDVTGARELKLFVRRRSGGIVQDVVNLVDARLIP